MPWQGLFTLPFYVACWVGAAAMLRAGMQGCGTEEVRLQGRDLTLVRHLELWDRDAKYRLAPDSRACVEEFDPSSHCLNAWAQRVTAISVRTDSGEYLRFAIGRARVEQERLVRRLNEYLESLPL